MARALRVAGEDSAPSGGGRGSSGPGPVTRVILPLSWRYVNPGLLVAGRSGSTPGSWRHGDRGEQPSDLVNATALQIARGSWTWPSSPGQSAGSRAGPPDATRGVRSWRGAPGRRHRAPGDARHRPRPGVSEDEAARGLDRPLRVFPLFENALRPRQAGRSTNISDSVRALGTVLVGGGNEPLRMVASTSLGAGHQVTGPSNRMVSFPYPKLMNANNRVDQGAALILCSVQAARARGCPRSGGCSRSRGRTPTTTGSCRIDTTCDRHPPSHRRPAGPGARGDRHGRRGSRRSVLVLPLRRADRRPRAGPPPRRSGPVPDRHGWSRVRRGSGQQLRDPLHRLDGRAPPGRSRRGGPRHGPGVVQHEARRRGVVDHPAGGGVSPCVAAG